MARITTFSEVTSTQGTTALEDEDVFLLDGSGGSKKITAKELAQAMADKLSKNAASVGKGYGKSGIYRGANLGSGATFAAASTADQRTAINNGTFAGLFIGDYWTVNGRVYRIADFNYWKSVGDSEFSTNHVVLIPDTIFGAQGMNTTNITTGAYTGSNLYTDASSVLNTARASIETDFGSYLAKHRELFSNAVTDGAESGSAWFTSTADLMSEPMACGHYILTAQAGGISYVNTTSKQQLALFRLNPTMLNIRTSYWLRNVSGAAKFAAINAQGGLSSYNASGNLGVRPVFTIKGTTS